MAITSKPPTEEYKQNWDRIFGKKQQVPYDGIANKAQYEAEAAHAEQAALYGDDEDDAPVSPTP